MITIPASPCPKSPASPPRGMRSLLLLLMAFAIGTPVFAEVTKLPLKAKMVSVAVDAPEWNAPNATQNDKPPEIFTPITINPADPTIGEDWSGFQLDIKAAVKTAAQSLEEPDWKSAEGPARGEPATPNSSRRRFQFTIAQPTGSEHFASRTDDGISIYVTEYEQGANGKKLVTRQIMDKFKKGMAFPDMKQSFHYAADPQFDTSRSYLVTVEYINTLYTGSEDLDGIALYFYSMPVITEVFERDQKWNKVPNPKSSPPYQNTIGIPPESFRNYLFVAVEPASNKVELTVKLFPGPGAMNETTMYVGIRDTTAPGNDDGPVLLGSAPISPAGEASIDFTPTGDLKDNELRQFQVIFGIDKNSNNKLDSDEEMKNDTPNARRFVVKAVTQADYLDSLNFLDTRDNWSLFYPVATSFLRYFDGNESTINDASRLTDIAVPITVNENPTHIAGSPYNSITGVTTYPLYQLPDGSTASNKIEATLDSTNLKGLRAVIYKTWYDNQASLAAPFSSNPSLPSSTVGPLTITGEISFYEANGAAETDLAKAYGEANIGGTITFGLKRDPSNALNIILTSITLAAVVKDTYDFDWTRGRATYSRRAATVQLGWQPPDRMGGRIFATETVLQRLYQNDDAITRFNNSWKITLPNPNPAPPIPPPIPRE